MYPSVSVGVPRGTAHSPSWGLRLLLRYSPKPTEAYDSLERRPQELVATRQRPGPKHPTVKHVVHRAEQVPCLAVFGLFALVAKDLWIPGTAMRDGVF